MYHDIVEPGEEDSSGFPGRDAARYKITPRRFEEQLQTIAERLHPRADMSKARGPCADACPTFTFDDGGESALVAADLLERYGWRGHFLVTASRIGSRGFVDGRALRDLHQRGHVIGSHSWSHPLRIGRCSWPRLLDEWTRSRDAISDILGRTIDVASVPGGDFTAAIAKAAARAGFALLFTSEPTARTRRIPGMEVRGRFTVRRRTPARTVARAAEGGWLPRARQMLLWEARKICKRLSGERYLQIRKLLLRHGDEVRWGDI